MLVLNKEKENLLVDKYGFEKRYTISDNNVFYYYGKSLTIYSHNHKNKGKLEVYSMSRKNQDMIYDLIMDNVLIKVDNEDREKIEKRITTMKVNIEKLQEKLEELINKKDNLK